MRPLALSLSLTVLFAFAPVARAATIGVVPSAQALDMMAGKENSYDLYALQGVTLTNLNTNIPKTNGSQVWLIGQTVYYNDADGLYSQPIGSSTPKKIRAQKSLSGELMLGKKWLISNKAKTAGSQSFFFNVQTKQVTKFTPAVKAIAAADATSDKLTLVMVAKNGQGKQKLFLSTTSIHKVREFPLPSKAKSCDGITIAPTGKTVIVGCTFTVSGSTTSKDGYAIYTRSGNDLKLVTKTVDNTSIGGLIWPDDQHAIVLADMASGAIDVHKWGIAKGKITSNKSLFSSGRSDSGGQSIVYAPFQLLRWTKNKFYYNIMFVYSSNTDVYFSLIGSYDLSTGENVVVANNSNFQVIFY